MSLHTLAQHLQSAGRGEDKVLVHMTPGEVSGLQSLAMAHGGSLTINPETGLPEAGFLSSILPMVAGAALTATGVGAPMAALMVGAAGTVATGSLNKGLMMGLGAYGGASLGAGLGLAPAAAASSAAPAAASAAAAPTTFAGGTPFTMPTVVPPVTAAAPAAGITAAGAPVAGTAFTPPVPAQPVVSTAPAGAPATTAPATVESSIGQRLKSAGQNVGRLFGSSEEDKAYRDAFLKEQKFPLMGAGLAALSLSREEQKMPQEQGGYTTFNPTYNRIAQSGGNYQAGAYPSATGERRYFADGGLADLPVARMSQENMTGGNQNYPMARIKPYGYAVPRNNPISQNVIKPMDYEQVDPYTGEQKFAGGGLAALATGGFISKLKAVAEPKKATPKLQSTSAIDKKIASLEKYSNIEEVQSRYNDLQNQIKELQQQKTNRAAESANAAKEYNASVAQINKDKANRLKELNSEFANRIKEIQADRGRPAKEKQAAIAEIQREQKSTIAGVNTEFADAIKNRQAEYNNFKKDYSASVKDFDTRIASLNKEATPAKSAAAMAKQYQDAVAARDKMIAANEAATSKANEQYESAMGKYNEYKDALAAEKQAWQEETGRKATGVQAIRPQTTTKSLGGSNAAQIAELEKQKASLPSMGMGGVNPQAAEIQKQIDDLKSGMAGYTPAYIKDPKTGKLIPSSEAPPITEFKPFTKVPGYDTTKRLMEEKDITAVFEDVAGRRPTKAEMDRFLGTQSTDAAIAQYAMNAADVKQAMKYTDDDFKENFQYYIGRQPTTGELSQMKKANITNFNQMRNFLQQQPAYLKNLNTVAQQAFTQQQKTAEEALAEQQRLSASLTPEQVSTAYRDVLGRTPSMDELRKYMGAQQTPQGLEGMLKGSEEYLGKLTQPLVPTPSAPRYAPGTVLEYTPTQPAATGLGAITGGVQPTPSGLQAPLTRGAVTLEGAMPLNPTFTEQMGLQTLATQAAEKAPQLQTGLQFQAQQPQNVFGFQPYGAPAQGTPQSLEAIMAALRAQQQQGVTQMAGGGYAGGGYHLGDYSDGGRLLKGPGDGVSDSIPASIGGRQPARLADGEFVIPARIVSELGNGSTDAGARKLYAMMDRIQRARTKTVGKQRVAVDSKAEKLLPA